MVIQRRMVATPPYYDETLKAQVIPWAHKLNTYLGYVFIFDDFTKKDQLVYFVPQLNGTISFQIHYCEASVTQMGGGILVTIVDQGPDPEHDATAGWVTVEPMNGS